VSDYTCLEEEIVRCNASVVEATKSILARRVSGTNKVRSMCMTFFLREDDSISIGNAVGHFMAFHSVDIELRVFTDKEYTSCEVDDIIEFGRRFRSFFDACPIFFSGVTRLYLENLTFGESDITNVLITCKGLKHLNLCYCDPAEGTIMRVDHSQLSELHIYATCFEKVELISLPKLTWIVFRGWYLQCPLFLGHVPLLETVSLSVINLSYYEMVKLSENFGATSPRYLWLGFECEKVPHDRSFC
jgi:hypothetical protein